MPSPTGQDNSSAYNWDMETDALTTYLIQQRQLAWLILGGGILAIVFAGVAISLGQTLFVRGLGIGMVIIAPFYLYYGLSLPGQLGAQHTTWVRLLAESPPVLLHVSQELQTLITGIDRLAWLYSALTLAGLAMALFWHQTSLGGIGGGVALMLLTSLVIEQLAKRHALVLLAAVGGINS